MLQRILDVPEEARRSLDLSSLRVVAVSGSSLPGSLATAFMDVFGDILYNLYGSTEVAYATWPRRPIYGPARTRRDVRCAAPPSRSSTATRCQCRPGASDTSTSRNELLFEGYTGGGTKASVRGLMSTGDVGRFDAQGRLTVEGRADDMIVSGGENVFPEEVEQLLAAHDAVVEVAVVGVADDQYGQRLKAYVVRKPGRVLSAEDVRGMRPIESRVPQGAARRRVHGRPPRNADRQGAPPTPRRTGRRGRSAARRSGRNVTFGPASHDLCWLCMG